MTRLTEKGFYFIVRLAVLSTAIMIIANAIHILTKEDMYCYISMLSSISALLSGFIIHKSKYKYSWKKVFFMEKIY